MTDYRDPNLRDPVRPDFRDPDVVDSESWSSATWGWIAGFAVVALVLIFAFTSWRDTSPVASDMTNPPITTTGQGGTPAAPPSTINPGAPTMTPDRPARNPQVPAPGAVPPAPQ